VRMTPRRAVRYGLGFVVAFLLLLTVGTPAAPASGPSPAVQPLVGAYYYLWNPENFAGGTLRAHLVPPQVPVSNLVNSQSPRTAARDISNARRAGINFFAVDWWPYVAGASGADYRAADSAMKDFLAAPNISAMRFAMFYETWNLGFDPGRESTPVTFEMELHFDADMATFAKDYFHNPSYLRIHGRPVVFLYLTRTLTGDVAGMINGARTVLRAKGFNPFFIGDEVYWRVTPEHPDPAGPLLTTTPQADRIAQFDAVTSYIDYYGDPNFFLGPTQDFTGYPGTTDIVADERHLLSEYRAATDGHVPVIPDISSSFNDRGFRLPTNHPAQPRQWLPGEGPASTLDHLFRCVALPEVDPALPMVMVTSWNDWNEDTGIEPVGGTPTATDDSPTGDAYTQGYTYGGEGRAALRVLRTDTTLLQQELDGSHATSAQKSAMASAAPCAPSPPSS
jgi:glycoprotein endo-alpha-1,2-mannosidase